MRVNFETERLVIRPFVPEDAEAAFRWCGDPAVNTYMIYPLYHRTEDVRAWLESRDLDDPDNYDEAIVLKSTGELIGSGGMVFHPERNAWEIGYNLRADQWGHGYVVEYLTALMDRIRRVRPVEAIDGVFAAENQKSRRVMEKLGMVWVRDTQYEKLDGSVELTEIAQSDVETHTGTQTLGGWSDAESPEITAELKALFDRATEGLLGVNYAPVALLSTQVVNGTNYCILCESTVVYPGAETAYAFVYLSKDLEDNAKVAEIVNFASDAGNE